jgi:hypothetical protein
MRSGTTAWITFHKTLGVFAQHFRHGADPDHLGAI